MKSIMQDNKEVCFLCGGRASEEHHIFGGTANRKLSEQYGLKVYLCPYCHRVGKKAVHSNKVVADVLHKRGQEEFEETHGDRMDFMRVFMKNYIMEGE